MLFLDRQYNQLYDSHARRLDRQSWCWVSETPPGTLAETISLADAVRWLQAESVTPWRAPVGLIGPRDATPEQRDLPAQLGAGIASLGLTLLCGGRQGVMEAACRGVKQAGGVSVGLLPDADWAMANPYVTIPIATGIGIARNAIITRASCCLVAIGGGYGTLSEIAFGLQFERPVFGLGGAPRVAGVVYLTEWPELETALCRAVLALPPGLPDTAQ